MLLDDIARGARRERFLIAAEKCRRARPRDRSREEAVDPEDDGIVHGRERGERTRDAALHVPDAEDKTLAIRDRDDRAGISPRRVRRRLRDDLRDLGRGELLSAALRPHFSRREDHARQRSQSEDGPLHEQVDLSGSGRWCVRQTFMRLLSTGAARSYPTKGAAGTQASCQCGQRASSLHRCASAGRMPARRTAWKAVFRFVG